MASIQSDFSGSLAPASSVVPLRCVVCLSRSCLLASSAMSFRHPYSGSPLPCPLVMLPRHLSIMWPRFSLLTALSFAPSLVSYRLASPLAPLLVSSSGAMSFCGRVRLASYRRRCRYDASIAGRGSLVLAMVPCASEMWHVRPLRACSPHPVSLAPLASPVVISYRPAARFPVVSLFRPVLSCRWAGSD